MEKLKQRYIYLKNRKKKNLNNNISKNLILKLITIFALILIILSTAVNSFAYSIGDKIVAKEKQEVPTLMKFGDMYIMCSIAEVEKDGKKYFAYCIEPKKNGVEIYGQYNLTILKKVSNNKIYSALKHGYPNKSIKELGVNNAGEAYLATTQAIFTMMFDRSVNQYSPVDSVAGRRTYEAYKKIVGNARKYPYVKPNPNIFIKCTSDWILSEDKRYLEKEFKVDTNITSGKYNLHLKNNNIQAEIIIKNLEETKDDLSVDNNKLNNLNVNDDFKLRVPIKNLVETGTLDIEVDSKENYEIAYEAVPNNSAAQKLAIVGVEEVKNVKDNINIEYIKNNTKLEIIKVDDETGKPLDGVKFNIYNEDKELIYENLETDNEGKTLIEGILPGKYFIKEVLTKKEYNLLEEEIEIEVEFNEITNIKIENVKKEIPEKEIQKIKKPMKILPKTGY